MIDKIINKYHINVYSMLKHGTVAVITMFGVGLLFGIKNIMLAFPIALTSTVLSRQNLQVKTTSKILKLIVVDLAIVLAAFISSQNSYLGIIINFISIFLIMYNIISPYDMAFYKPFIMLYIFTQYARVSLEELPLRILAVIFGVLVIECSNIITKVNEKSKLGNSITSSLLLIKTQLNNIIDGKFEEDIVKKCSKIMRELVYKVYITRHKKYLTTNLGRIQFNIYINMEYLNLYLRNIYFEYNNNDIQKNEVEDTINVIDDILDYSNYSITVEELENKINLFKDMYNNKSRTLTEICNIMNSLKISIKELKELGNKEINKIYSEWEKENIENFKESFHKGMRFNFAMRMAITLTIVLFIGEILGYYKIIWAIITIMSVIQPYYEYTLNKTKERIIGNVIGILFTGIFINLVNIKWITILILIASLYLLYGFKEYYKISLFASIASICIASLTENINVLLIYRVIYVIIGVAIVIIVNKKVFPYKLKDGIDELIIKIDKLNTMLINYSIAILNGTENPNKVRNIIIHSTLLCEKLEIRNTNFNDNNINRIANLNNEFVVQVGYRVLK
ncbi:FUSC family protein [Clostridium botulinum]|uniref:FUSC family protein n=1 Tax=Clostridium botulinum TaxID=1491 RepID=A0A6B4JMU0_CLOBO|nr:FUSC family protein [Clostridium botulinum]EES48943.1 putative membrane protein [Clostridium botulinum E1 str. 'BoNT E Beluga']MBY6762258.1 FUSC family protein [Clostridium botulinum]MBY6920429.1 FUSC family protein [Clostridium botulinum]MCR1131857.1 FUSC family protein [Clostridium botulinum]NFJ58273.1 FUSC family protein [Clostridium botulinum]